MRIGIYVRGLSHNVGGAWEYAKSMTEAMIDQIGKNDLLYIIHNLDKEYFKSDKENVKEIMMKCNNRVVCDMVLAPFVINRLNLDVVWFTKNVVPYFIKTNKIVTVHDLAYFFREYNAYPLIDTLYMKFMIRSSCRRADKIIAVSKNTKNDIKKILKVSTEKINTIYEGIGKNFTRTEDKRQLRDMKKKYNLPNQFLLFTGDISPRKNLARLIKAFSGIATKKDLYLVITGPEGWKNKIEKKLIDENPEIRKIGLVEYEDLPALYTLAELYVYPSLYEGFGLPILEAQACGCPVVCSNTSSITEVGGNSVHYVNPYDTKDIQTGIMKVLQDQKYRNTLIKKGFNNIKRFSWERSAKKILRIMKNGIH